VWQTRCRQECRRGKRECLRHSEDYAMNRYYAPQWGRFTIPDPYQASAQLANPQSWNRYSYVENDPVNRVDPSGLDGISAEFDNYIFRITATGRYFGGGGGGGGGGWFGPQPAQLMAPPDMDTNWQSGSGSGPLLNASFIAGANALFRASDFLIGRIAQNSLPKDCVKILAAAGVPDLGKLRSAAGDMQVWDGTTEYILRESSLRQEPARSAVINSGKDRTIADAFAAGGGTITVMAQLGGNLIFIDGARIDPGNQKAVGALLVHELLHNVTGHVDDVMAGRMGISEKEFRERGSVVISNKIKEKCF
jgi:RHS repeat-associated protein